MIHEILNFVLILETYWKELVKLSVSVLSVSAFAFLISGFWYKADKTDMSDLSVLKCRKNGQNLHVRFVRFDRYITLKKRTKRTCPFCLLYPFFRSEKAFTTEKADKTDISFYCPLCPCFLFLISVT